ncbi:MAG: hypothetical protein BWY25_00478 [Chloroflexi bacterium ADurb.Bin222]|nr:MAG: hypothetical protein BWY25_00478 [Chloroflexi bacterium ADurb.Bin222]
MRLLIKLIADGIVVRQDALIPIGPMAQAGKTRFDAGVQESNGDALPEMALGPHVRRPHGFGEFHVPPCRIARNLNGMIREHALNAPGCGESVASGDGNAGQNSVNHGIALQHPPAVLSDCDSGAFQGGAPHDNRDP